MNISVGHAGQPGYTVKGGDEVILQAATNLPIGSKIDYFAARDDGNENFIGIGENDVRVIVDWDDIEGSIEPDDWNDAPWDDCDGWDHETRKLGYYDHDGIKESRGYARTQWNDPNVLIELDDDDIINTWGHTRRAGESKQVWLERVARIKRSALDQLVKWYEDGWSYNYVRAEFGDYSDGCGGILCDDTTDGIKYLDTMVLESRHEVASQLEDNGYIVEGRPTGIRWSYNKIDHHRDRIRRNLDMS